MGFPWKGSVEVFCPFLNAYMFDLVVLQLYRILGDKKLARQAFDHARSIDPSLALPWAGMSVDSSDGLVIHSSKIHLCLSLFVKCLIVILTCFT